MPDLTVEEKTKSIILIDNIEKQLENHHNQKFNYCRGSANHKN